MFAELIKALRQVGCDPTDEMITEALWMLQFLPDSSPADSAAAQPAGPTAAPSQRQGATPVAPQPVGPSPVEDEKAGAAEIFPQADAAAGAARMVGGVGITTPGVPALADTLALTRALRPLARRVFSRVNCVVDEQETARRMAEERIFVPVLRPVRTRWLTLHVVIDQSPSMAIWQKLLAELQQLVLRLGAFRNVRLWSMHAEHEQEEP